MSGWAWGPRFLVPLLPLWFLPIAFSFPAWHPRKRVVLWRAAIGVSILLQIPGILVYDNQFHHLKESLLTPEEQTFAASDYISAWVLLRHKFVVGNEVYRVSEFGVPSDRTVDLGK